MVPYLDHVIAKPPHNLATTAWHQDTAYADPSEVRPPSVHVLLALQDATVDNGCMRFIPWTLHFRDQGSEAVRALVPRPVREWRRRRRDG